MEHFLRRPLISVGVLYFLGLCSDSDKKEVFKQQQEEKEKDKNKEDSDERQ